MATYIPEFLVAREEELRQQKRIAQELGRALDSFRSAADALRDAAADADGLGLSRQRLAEGWSMTSTERNIAFDAAHRLVREPLARTGRPGPANDDAATAGADGADGEDLGTDAAPDVAADAAHGRDGTPDTGDPTGEGDGDAAATPGEWNGWQGGGQ